MITVVWACVKRIRTRPEGVYTRSLPEEFTTLDNLFDCVRVRVALLGSDLGLGIVIFISYLVPLYVNHLFEYVKKRKKKILLCQPTSAAAQI